MKMFELKNLSKEACDRCGLGASRYKSNSVGILVYHIQR